MANFTKRPTRIDKNGDEQAILDTSDIVQTILPSANETKKVVSQKALADVVASLTTGTGGTSDLTNSINALDTRVDVLEKIIDPNDETYLTTDDINLGGNSNNKTNRLSSTFETNRTTIKEATHSSTADNATHATSADSATNATHASTADNATHATSATSATNATSADKVNKTLTIGAKTFNGSSDVTVDTATEILKGIALLGASGGSARYGYKGDVGLGNVDNTADSAKSVNYASTAGTATTAKNVSITGDDGTWTVGGSNLVCITGTVSLTRNQNIKIKFGSNHTKTGPGGGSQDETQHDAFSRFPIIILNMEHTDNASASDGYHILQVTNFGFQARNNSLPIQFRWYAIGVGWGLKSGAMEDFPTLV